ncbi:response regulator [Emticicia sp. C21]|uniref:response regulator n=1 Tax=Emticicia sp. C21 TaxID=2302915 RepID=UPI000E34119D|nr:response regulator [Emticicia sp. C21]RFS15051.1 DNA-binding response regulator [Emticicia sp. C21]
MNILIIEDEIITATDLKETLEENGHYVQDICKSYNEAINAIRIKVPDLAIVDIKLRNSTTDGIAIAEELNRDFDIPIIYLTSQADNATFDRAKLTQPAAYLLKPFRHNELVYQIELAYNHFLINKPVVTNPSKAESVFFPYQKGHQKIKKKQIQFIKAEGHYVNIYIENEKKPLLFTMNIGYIAQFFTTSDFYKLTRSYIVNLEQIVRFDAEFIYFENSQEKVSIPQGQRQDFLKRVALIKTP